MDCLYYNSFNAVVSFHESHFKYFVKLGLVWIIGDDNDDDDNNSYSFGGLLLCDHINLIFKFNPLLNLLRYELLSFYRKRVT